MYLSAFNVIKYTLLHPSDADGEVASFTSWTKLQVNTHSSDTMGPFFDTLYFITKFDWQVTNEKGTWNFLIWWWSSSPWWRRIWRKMYLYRSTHYSEYKRMMMFLMLLKWSVSILQYKQQIRVDAKIFSISSSSSDSLGLSRRQLHLSLLCQWGQEGNKMRHTPAQLWATFMSPNPLTKRTLVA